nr:hypothetical protein Itr_chr14CG13390 [Ipomoea trifida]
MRVQNKLTPTTKIYLSIFPHEKHWTKVVGKRKKISSSYIYSTQLEVYVSNQWVRLLLSFCPRTSGKDMHKVKLER